MASWVLTCWFTWCILSRAALLPVTSANQQSKQQRPPVLTLVFEVREVDGPVADLVPPLPHPQIFDLRTHYLEFLQTENRDPQRSSADADAGGALDQLRFQVLEPSGQRQLTNGPLQLNVSGLLSVGPVDREDPTLCSPQFGSDSVCVLRLHVMVISWNAVRSDTLVVLVNVSDVDDHVPRWPTSEVRLEVRESNGEARDVGPGPKWVPGDIPLAQDADAAENAAIIYSIVRLDWHEPSWPDTRWDLDPRGAHRGPFRLVVAHDAIRLQLVPGPVGELDRETRDRYRIRIQAAASNGRYRPTELTVVVDVLDANDNRPAFAQDNYNIRVREDVAVGSFLEELTLRATDPDAGQNGELLYSVVESESTCKSFAVDTFSEGRPPATAAPVARVQVMRALDYETGTRSCVLVVRASDLGSPAALSSTARVTVEVVNVNDNDPQIIVRCHPPPTAVMQRARDPLPDGESLVAMAEDATLGTDVPCGIRVSDADFGPVTCALDDASARFLVLSSRATSSTGAMYAHNMPCTKTSPDNNSYSRVDNIF